MKRALLAAVPAVLVIGLVACGDDDDNTAVVTTSAATNTTTPSTATESATAPTTSLATATTGTSATAGSSDITLPGGVTLPDLGSILPGGSLPNLSIPDISIPDLGSALPNVEETLKKVFPQLTDDQASCLAEHLSGSNMSMSAITAVMDDCNIDVRDLIPGG